MNLEELKKEILHLIADHNKSGKHIRVEPIKEFGEAEGTLRFYWADYYEDGATKHTLGVTYHSLSNTFHEFHDQKVLNFGNVLQNFQDQLSNVPEA